MSVPADRSTRHHIQVSRRRQAGEGGTLKNGKWVPPDPEKMQALFRDVGTDGKY